MDTFTPVTELAQAIRSGDLSPVELVDACLDRVDRLDPQLNAVIWRNDDEARKEALRVADEVARGADLPPFAGVPIPIKDLTAVAGWPTTYGSWATGDDPSPEDELVVAALRRAGFILCGRTNTPEFGPIPVTENLRYGITRNPWDTERSPGGSSGGAGAATAAGLFPVAHANDGGGSIRIPASCCGLVGLKPSRGRVPAVVPGWMGASVEGVVTRTVGDAAAVLDVISGPDRLAWFNAPVPERPFAAEPGTDPGRRRIGLLTRAPLDLPVAETPAAAAAVAGQALEAAGHHVEVLDIELFPVEALVAFMPVVNSGFGDYLDVDFSKMEPHNVAAYAAGQEVSAIDFVRALGDLQRFSRQAVARFGDEFDFLVTPTMAIEPPRAGTILAESHAAPGQTPGDVLAMAAFTAPFNVAGLPAVSLPLHQTAAGLPVGVQVVAGPWDEAGLLRLAAQLEAALPWVARRPTVS
jgi:amidase